MRIPPPPPPSEPVLVVVRIWFSLLLPGTMSMPMISPFSSSTRASVPSGVMPMAPPPEPVLVVVLTAPV